MDCTAEISNNWYRHGIKLVCRGLGLLRNLKQSHICVIEHIACCVSHIGSQIVATENFDGINAMSNY